MFVMKYDQIEGMAQALFEETGDALFFFDPDTDQILDANAMAQRLTGFAVRDLHRMHVADLFHPAGQEGRDKFRRAARKTTIFHSQEGYFLQTVRDGVRIPVNLTVARLHVKPKTLGLITARDVRKQQETLARLQSTEAELRRVLYSVSDCLWSGEVDPAGRWVYHYFSPVAEKVAGQPPEFFLAGVHRWWSVVHPEDQARWTRALARQRAGQETQEEYRVVWPDGSVHWVRESVRASREARQAGSIRLDGVVTDVTARRAAEQALRASEERFQAFMDHSPTAAFMKDDQGRFLYANKPFQDLFPAAAGPVIGKTDAELFPAEVVDQLRANDATVLAGNQPLQAVEMRPSPGGELRPWLVIKFPFQDSAGRRFVGGVGLEVAAWQGMERQAQAPKTP